MGSHIERRLGRELQRVGDEALFADVVAHRGGARQPAQVRDATHDARELLVARLAIGLLLLGWTLRGA